MALLMLEIQQPQLSVFPTDLAQSWPQVPKASLVLVVLYLRALTRTQL